MPKPQDKESAKISQQLGSQMRITPPEREMIRRTFAGNDELLKLMRKLFLPDIDPAAPIGQVIDLWMTVKTEGLSMEQQLINLTARNEVIRHVEQQLIQLKAIADTDPETAEEAMENLKKNSSK